MESTPVWGVAIRKAVVAPREAPSFRRDMAVGSTPHEQSGSGMPSRVALMTERNGSQTCRLIWRKLFKKAATGHLENICIKIRKKIKASDLFLAE